jgi:hypothetical protein
MYTETPEAVLQFFSVLTEKDEPSEGTPATPPCTLFSVIKKTLIINFKKAGTPQVAPASLDLFYMALGLTCPTYS